MAALRSAPALRLARLAALPRRAPRCPATAKAPPPPPPPFDSLDTFTDRHVGPDDHEASFMLSKPASWPPPSPQQSASPPPPSATSPCPPSELHARAKALGSQNRKFKSCIGMGHHNAAVPPVILRSAMENPAWYTPYTPYQPEVAQGRLESLVNYQTMIASLTGMDVANASLLDETTAAAEGMAMSYAHSGQKRKSFFVDSAVLPQTIAALRTRAKGSGIRPLVGDSRAALEDPELRADLADQVHASGALVVCATDLLALTLLTPPGEWGADVVLENSARFGVPAGYGGPHGAFFAVTDRLKRKMPGRLIGRSKDTVGSPAYRLALQTREQHIRREKATSNICTSQALLANMAAMYAVYHSPVGLTRIAEKIHLFAQLLHAGVGRVGFRVVNDAYFDTLTIDVSPVCKNAEAVHAAAALKSINLRRIDSTRVGVTFDESVGYEGLETLVSVFSTTASGPTEVLASIPEPIAAALPSSLVRTSGFRVSNSCG
ncbi:glycine cleavage system P-protein-domain-containing protein [Boletus edulis BED1]|uniref:glycine dehydrogenase (aminomethyl-transferring) n=1 Tax=Boletus edulis BED1 TaxID=1328754 RepID=A0AAD4BFG3_BOLED|nr:glycine cleavage system P-protein-domain-containing protein [Boletus edulis BED1]